MTIINQICIKADHYASANHQGTPRAHQSEVEAHQSTTEANQYPKEASQTAPPPMPEHID